MTDDGGLSEARERLTAETFGRNADRALADAELAQARHEQDEASKRAVVEFLSAVQPSRVEVTVHTEHVPVEWRSASPVYFDRHAGNRVLTFGFKRVKTEIRQYNKERGHRIWDHAGQSVHILTDARGDV